MSRFNTGNPIGSNDPRDRDDNTKNLDELVNSKTKTNVPDRLGVPRKTWHGIESEFSAEQSARTSEFNADQTDRHSEFSADQSLRASQWQDFLLSQGFQDVGVYQGGLELIAYNQAFTHNGEGYRLATGVELPFITTGDFTADSPNFVKLQFITTTMLDDERQARVAGDANLQSQISGAAPLEASAFSPISWHGQVIQNSVAIPDNVNAWSFGPEMTIAAGHSVTIGENSHWTIANGEIQ